MIHELVGMCVCVHKRERRGMCVSVAFKKAPLTSCVCVVRTDSFRQAESTVVEKWPASLVQLQVELCSRFVRVKKNDVFCRRGGGDAKFASLVFEIPEPRAVP